MTDEDTGIEETNLSSKEENTEESSNSINKDKTYAPESTKSNT